MKKLNLLNRSGMSPDGTSRKGRYCLDPILSRFCVVSLIYANKLLNHRTTPLGRFVLPEHLPFSKPKVNWLLHVSLICLCMLTVGSGNVWGAKDDVVYKINTASTKIATSTTYANYGPSTCASAQAGSTVSSASWCVTCGSAQTEGLWLGANNNQKAKMTLGNGSFTEASGIASAIGVTTSATYYAAMICRTNLSKVYKVTLTYATPGGTAPSEAWILYSTDNGSTWSVGKKVTSLSTSGTDFVFDATITSAARYAFVIHSTGYCQFKKPVLTFYEGTTGGTTYTVTYNLNGGGGTTPTESAKSSGATFSLHNGTTGITPPSGKVFSQWKDQDNNYYNGGATYTMPAKNVTLTAQWVNTYTVTYNLNGGTGTTPTEGAHPSGATFTLHDGTTGITAPTKKEFSKWRDQDGSDYNGGVTYTMPAKAVTLTAQWVAAGGDYVLVEDAEDIGPGKYLIVYNNTNALNTHYGNVNANTYATYTNISSYYSNKKIASNATTDALAYTVAETTNGYSISHIESGTTYYLGNSSNSTGSTLRWDNPFTTSQDEWTLGVNSIVSARNSSYAIRWNNNSSSYRFAIYNTAGQQAVQLFKQVEACEEAELAYSPATETKTYGDAAFTKTLTNSHSVAVTYALSDVSPAGCVSINTSTGQVTINGAGSATITASSAAQTVTAVSYCADEASYTLTVNKADISPTLTYDPAAVTVGSTLTSFTLSGNSGSGTVTYVSSNDAIATVNSSGVVTGVAPGTVTITATIAATTNYNGNTATSNTITVNAAACTGVNSLHTGNKDQGGWVTNQCFEDADWGAADDAIYVGAFPLTNECYVGWAGGNSYHGTYWAVGGIKTYDIPTGRTLGWNSGNYYESYPGGALGTFHIYKNSTDENYYLRFKPSSYILRTGSDGTSWTSREMTVSATNSHYYETAELDLTSTLISEHAYVDLKTNGGDGHVWCNFSNDRTASGNVKVKSSVGDADGNFRGDNLKASDNGTHGKFRIDVTKDVDNWKLAFVPMYRITYAPGTGASGSMDPSSYAEISTTIAAAAEGFTDPTGKQFNGWSDGVNSYAAGANVTMNSNVTLTAQWTDIDYTVTVSQSPDVSATTTGQTSSAHYNGTINLTVTDIPSGYRFVNWTTSDGFSITNSTSATTASFTMPAKNVTVTANFQQTHKVDWYVGGSAPANKIGDDGQTTVVDHGGKISAFPATTPDGSPCDKTFVGWTNTTSYTHGTSLLFNDVAGSPTINADANFYAVFAEVNSVSASLTKMTADDDLEVGDKIVIIAQDTRYGMYQASASSYVSYWTTTDVDGEPSLSEIEADDKKYLDVAAGSASNTWKLGDATNGYLYNASSTNLEFSTTNSSDLTLITWTDDSFTFVAGQEVSCRTDITGANANKWRGAGASCDPETGDNCSGTPYYYLYKYVPSSTTATGHTIICASCSNEVTVSFSAPGSGNSMTVAKGVTSISSGDAVKTCSAVSLTVTLTPAAHYTADGLSATGVTGVTTSHVGNVYTVNIPADKTGTLTLTPTFTAETPLTITLDTHSKGTFTPIGTIYSGDSFTFPEVTPNDAECADFVGWVEGTSIAEEGTSTEPTTIAAGSSSGTLTTNKTYTAVYAEKDKTESDAYVKVTSSLSNWSGTYLIVHDGSSRALDGSLTSDLGSTGDYFSVSITDGAIAATSTLATKNWTIAKIGETSTYTIKSASGYYIGRATASNGLDKTTTAGDADANSITYSSGVSIAGSASTAKLQYWVSGANACFKYYTSSQNAVSLYKLGTAEVVTYTYTVNPACTAKYRVTVNSATGGSPNADPKYLPEGETVTLTANPAAGYTFTSWTITKTTGGDNVTSTLLTGDKPTTANTSFAMPAYDVTVTATYAKIYVTSVVAKDGETTLNTSDHKLNINTGANKTVTVVVTPADAFDHSWTASVTSGDTYASISNVTADGFRVNGLAEGDATIVVTAPNDDGADKTATFTVHVTDIMPEEIILKREGSDTPIETLIMYYDASESKGQYVKVNVGYSPANPTNKAFTFSSALTGKVGSHSHAPASGYEVLVANGVTTDPVNCTFTSSADGSVTKVLAVTVLPILTDRFVDYVHGNATQTVSARLSVDRFSIITDINTPSLSDASDADPTSEDCETAHYHLIGWLPQATAEALWAAGTPITEATEGLVRAGVQVEATGQTWCAIWAEEAE